MKVFIIFAKVNTLVSLLREFLMSMNEFGKICLIIVCIVTSVQFNPMDVRADRTVAEETGYYFSSDLNTHAMVGLPSEYVFGNGYHVAIVDNFFNKKLLKDKNLKKENMMLTIVVGNHISHIRHITHCSYILSQLQRLNI